MINRDRLRYRIEELGYSQEQVARRIGNSRKNFCDKLRGKARFNEYDIKALADIMYMEHPYEFLFHD